MQEFTQFNDPLSFSRLNGESESTTQGDLLGLESSNQPSTSASSSAPKSVEIIDIEEDYDPSVE